MLRRTTKLSLRLGAFVALAYLTKWLLDKRSSPTPVPVAPQVHTQPDPPPAPEPPPEPGPVRVETAPEVLVETPVADEPEPARPPKVTTKAEKKKAAPKRTATRKPPEHVPPETPVGALMSWVEPVGNVCPPSHPIKVKLASRVFRRPGGAGYDNSKPDRCYASEGAATRAGFQEAQR